MKKKLKYPLIFSLLLISGQLFTLMQEKLDLCSFDVSGRLKVKLELGAEVGAELWDKGFR